MLEKVDGRIRRFIEEEILTLYDKNDIGGHGRAHIQTVINRSFELMEQFDELKDLDPNMVYVIAAFHDIGYKTNPDDHEEESARMFKENARVKEFFTPEQIEIMTEAIAEHRASLEGDPHTVYGKLVSSADREISVENMLERSILFQADKHKAENPTVGQVIDYSFKKLSSKYGKGGYANMYYQDQKYIDYLRNMQELLEDKEKFVRAEFNLMNQKLKAKKVEQLDEPFN